MMSQGLPERSVIAEKISALINGEISRETMSAWALSVVLDDNYGMSDIAAWKTLTILGGADLCISKGQYLYGEADFKIWLKLLA